jgi:LysR family transcriptional regulator, glycine cleavage system transcriptional activator
MPSAKPGSTPSRLPPLSTLPVLEAAARLGSFSAAADELHVTHGAVSHQIRSLEEHLGVSLFLRSGRRVVLTPEGETLARAVRIALGQVTDAVDTIRPAARENRLTISTIPSFAGRWLMPRISNFLSLYPQYVVSVEASYALTDFVTDGVDVGIRFGSPPWPGLNSEWIADDSYYLVCSPKFRRGRLPTQFSQLNTLPLMYTEDGLWARYFELAGLGKPPKITGVQFNDASLNLQHAIDGEGIALTRKSLVARDVAEGKLARLFDIEIASRSSYYLVCPDGRERQQKIRDLRGWLLGAIDWEPNRDGLPPERSSA